LPGQLVRPDHPQPVDRRRQMFFENFRHVRPGVTADHEVRY
jgi:hypothetical protein